mgnify:CR=1 FL=1
MRGRDALWWGGLVWAGGLVLGLAMLALYTWLPADGATGDLQSFTDQGYRVQWLLQERAGGLQVGDVIVRAGGYHAGKVTGHDGVDGRAADADLAVGILGIEAAGAHGAVLAAGRIGPDGAGFHVHGPIKGGFAEVWRLAYPVVITMASIGGPVEELGQHVAAALVGTFLGILFAYGLVGPMANQLESRNAEEASFYQVIKVCLMANVNGYSPQICIEFGRKAMPTALRPSFADMETHLKESK